MTEHKDHFHHLPDEDAMYAMHAPSALLPSILTRLGLSEPYVASDTSLEALRDALSSPVWTVRATAVHEMANLRDPESFNLLLLALRDDDPAVRAAAVSVFGIRGNTTEITMRAHLEVALNDSDWHVRETATSALNIERSQAQLTAPHEALNSNDGKRKESIMLEEKRVVLETHAPLIGTEVPISPTMHSKSPVASRQRHLWRVFVYGLAAVLVLGLITAWFGQANFSRPSSTTNITRFTDANALQLGAPLYTFQTKQPPSTSYGQFSTDPRQFGGWSADSSTFSSLQVNAEGNKLQVHFLDVVSGKTMLYSVLDSSWLSATKQGYQQGSFQLVGKDLVAIRLAGKNSAQMEIWNITGQRQVAQEIVPGVNYVPNTPYPLLPSIIPTHDGQKFALYTQNGSLEIWDTASGQKLATCQGLLSNESIWGGTVWYNNDQDVLSFDQNGHLQVWNASTGQTLFTQNNPAKTYYESVVSPDSKYLALAMGSQSAFRSSTPTIESIEILDASTGKVLHTEPQDYPLGDIFQLLVWLPDSTHLRTEHPLVHSNNVQLRVWNAFTDQDVLNKTLPNTPPRFYSFTQDSQYLILGNAHNNALDILRTSDRHKIATIATPEYTPGIAGSIIVSVGKDILFFQNNKMYVWSVSTGKLLYKYDGAMPYAGTNERDQAWESLLSPNGQYLVLINYLNTQSGTATVNIWHFA